jgi:hypothetical protein
MPPWWLEDIGAGLLLSPKAVAASFCFEDAAVIGQPTEIGAAVTLGIACRHLDIPLDADGYDAGRDCKNDDCVVARTVSFEMVLVPGITDLRNTV